MFDRRHFLSHACAAAIAGAFGSSATAARAFSVSMSDEEWRRRLSADQYEILRHAGTEKPFASPLLEEHRKGVFGCAGCARDLFASQTKFDSGTGWPSFWKPLNGAVVQGADRSGGMNRTAISCSRCGGHLGHVFNDGPRPTGLRYCMNGLAMTFRPATA